MITKVDCASPQSKNLGLDKVNYEMWVYRSLIATAQRLFSFLSTRSGAGGLRLLRDPKGEGVWVMRNATAPPP